MDEVDGDAVLSFLKSMDSSDDESGGDVKLTSKGQSTDVKQRTASNMCHRIPQNDTTKISDMQYPGKARSVPFKPSLALRDAGPSMASNTKTSNYRVTKCSETVNGAEAYVNENVEDSGEINLASIRAVAKKEASGAALLSCLDEVALSLHWLAITCRIPSILMALHIFTIIHGSRQQRGAAGLVTERRVAAPLDGHVLEGVLSEAECERLIALTEGLGFSFWHPSRCR